MFSLKFQFYSYLVENNQKAMLNVYFKSRYSMKPGSQYSFHTIVPESSYFVCNPSPYRVNILSFQIRLTFAWLVLSKLKPQILQKMASRWIFVKQRLEGLELDKKWCFGLIQTRTRQKHKMIVPYAIGKWSYITSVGFKNPKTSRTKFFRQS